jgi:sugar/nucleoside kinase (ribokinase family)
MGKISGPKLVAVTAGKHGASLIAGKKQWNAPALQVDSVEETGAGDAFGSGILAGLIQGLKPEEALRMGIANGAAVTTQFGPKAGLLFTPEMRQWLKKI